MEQGNIGMNKAVAEFLGTFTLVLFGCGAAVIAGPQIGLTGISFAFGLALVGMAYGIGAVSGCHINPAVSLGMVAAGRMGLPEAVKYIVAQVAGAVAGAGVLLVIASGKADYGLAEVGLGQNGWGAGYLGEYSLTAAFVFEAVATFLFMVVILGSTGAGAPTVMAGLAIGLALVVIHLVGINVTGVSVNPARSIGPALFVGGTALSQLWLFIVAPVWGSRGGSCVRGRPSGTVEVSALQAARQGAAGVQCNPAAQFLSEGGIRGHVGLQGVTQALPSAPPTSSGTPAATGTSPTTPSPPGNRPKALGGLAHSAGIRRGSGQPR